MSGEYLENRYADLTLNRDDVVVSVNTVQNLRGRDEVLVIEEWQERGWLVRLVGGRSSKSLFQVSTPLGWQTSIQVFNRGTGDPYISTDSKYLLLGINEEIICITSYGKVAWQVDVAFFYNPTRFIGGVNYVIYDEGSVGWGVADNELEFDDGWLPGNIESKRTKCRDLATGKLLWDKPTLMVGTPLLQNDDDVVLFLRLRCPESYLDYTAYRSATPETKLDMFYFDLRDALSGRLLATWRLPAEGQQADIIRALFRHGGDTRYLSTKRGFLIDSRMSALPNRLESSKQACEIIFTDQVAYIELRRDTLKFRLSPTWIAAARCDARLARRSFAAHGYQSPATRVQSIYGECATAGLGRGTGEF